MKKKQLLYTSVHPAPYIDKMLEHLMEEYNISIIYNRLSDKYKQWQNYTCLNGFVFEELSVIKLIKLVKQSDFVLISGWASWDNIKLIILSKILNKKVGLFSDCPEKVNKRSVKYLFKRLFLLRLIDYVFCSCKSTIEIFYNIYKFNPDKLKLFPYAAHFPDIEHIKTINRKREDALSNGSIPRIFISNSFYKRKGYSILFEMFKDIAQAELLDKFDISIAGIGEEYEEFKLKFNSLSPKIKFLGWLEHNEYINQLNKADIFIHASLFEPFGIPPIDAMARGKLVIVSDGVQSTKDLIVNDQNGYTYVSSDWQQLSLIIKNINVESIYNKGLRAMETSLKHYSYDLFSRALNDCIQE